MTIRVRITFEGKKEDDDTTVSSNFNSLEDDAFKDWVEKIKPLEKESKRECKIKGFARPLKGES